MNPAIFASAASLAVSSIAAASSTCAVFSRITDTVQISGVNSVLQGDYTLEWSGYLLDSPVVTNPPATVNARIWSEQNSVTEDKGLGLLPDGRPAGWVNSSCFAVVSGSSPLTRRAPVHVALVRSGSTASVFVNGQRVSSEVAACSPLNGSGSNMSLGAFVYVGQPTSNFWRAAPVALDWVRISRVARYSAPFAIPSEPQASDADTQLLVNFNGANPWRDLANPASVLSPGAGVSGGTSPTISADFADCNNDGIVDSFQCRNGSLPDYDCDNIPDCCEARMPCVAGKYPVQWRAQDGGNGHWYMIAEDPVEIAQWTENAPPAAMPAFRLVEVNDDSENQFLIQLAERFAGNPPLWIGLYRIAGTQWGWRGGATSDFTAWGGASCGAGPYPNYGYNGFLAAALGRRADCGWNWDDWAPEISPGRWQLLEAESDCNGDGIVDYGQILRGQLADADSDGVPDSCQVPTCVEADLYPNGQVDGADLAIVLSEWGAVTPTTTSDISGDGRVDGQDLAFVLSFWGACGN